MDRPLLEVEELSKAFGGVHAVNSATFHVAKGTITALIGPNGAGKTTAFNLVSGFMRPDSGRIRLAGSDITSKSAHAVARMGLMRTFQLTRVIPAMSVLDNVLLGAQDLRGEGWLSLARRPFGWRRSEKECGERALEILESIQLVRLKDAFAADLSGGQRKLLELARILMAKPGLVLLDEPLAGVNPALRAEILDIIVRLRDTSDLTFLWIEHDIDAVMKFADQVVVMANGHVIVAGRPESVRSDPRVVDAYLGVAAQIGELS